MMFRNGLAGALAGVLLAATSAPAAQTGGAQLGNHLQVLDVLNWDLAVSDSRDKSGLGTLRLLVADPELGLVGMYREGDRVLFFETLPVAMADVEAAADKLHSGLLAARFVSEDGHTLAIAGATAAPEAWFPPSADAGVEMQEKSRVQDGLRMAAVAATALQTHLLDSLYAEDVSLLARLAQHAPKALAEGELVAIDEQPINGGGQRQSQAQQQWKAHMDRSLKVLRANAGAVEIELAGARAEALQIEEMDEPGEFRIEVYARLATAEGRTVVAQLAGHMDTDGWFGPTLQVPMDWGTQTIMLDPTQTRGDVTEDLIKSVIDNAAALSAAHLASRAGSKDLPQWAVQAWADNTVGLREQLLPMRDALSNTQEKSTYTYYNRLYVHDKALAVVARHSASVIRNYRKLNSTGAVTLVTTHNFCNEGTCALSMSRKCGPVNSTNSSTGWRMPPVRTSHPDDPAGGVKHSCGTRYSLAFRSNRHNCHSDTWTQVRAVKGLSHGAFSHKCLEPKEIAAHCNH